MKNFQHMAYNYRRRSAGAVIAETLIAIPVLFMLVMGAVQWGLIYQAKATLNHAAFQGARLGAMDNANVSVIRRGVAQGLLPLFSPNSSYAGALNTYYTDVMPDLGLYSRIRILNPTQEAFADFGETVRGVRQLPNERLYRASAAIGSRSGLNLQDANLLKVEVTYGYPLRAPFVGQLMARTLLWLPGTGYTAFERFLLSQDRVPIVSTATVRMQSRAHLNNSMVSVADAPDLVRSTTGPEPNPIGGDGDTGGGDTGGGDTGGGDTGGGDTGGGDTGGGDTGGGDTGGGDTGGGDTGGGDTGGGDTGGGDTGGGDTGGGDTGDTGNGDTSCNSTGGRSASTGTSTGLPAQSVGNPINVTNGNKYERESDLSDLPGEMPVFFARHYNSRTQARGPLGVGWRHSYYLQLRVSGERLDLLQADGRLLRFDLEGQDAEGNARYRGRLAADGEVTADAIGYLWRQPGSKRLRFSREGQLQEIRRRGARLQLHYDRDGRLHQVIDSQGRRLSFTYDQRERLVSITDPAGARTRYRYDARNNLQSVIRPDGATRHYHYEDSKDPHNLTGITDERGVRYASWLYDSQDRAIYSSHADQVGEVHLDFSVPGKTRVTDNQGRVSTYLLQTQNEINHVLAIQGPGCSLCGVGNVTYQYDDRHQVIARTTKDGTTYRYQYDDLGRATVISRQLSEQSPELISRYQYEGESRRPVSIIRPSVNPDGKHVLRTRYNANRQLMELTERGWRPKADGNFDAIERSTRLVYDESGNLILIDGPREDVNDHTRFDYDSSQRLSGIILADGTTYRVLAFDNNGRPTEVQLAEQAPLKLKYNKLGKPLQIEQGKRVVMYGYDAAGELTSIQDPDGKIVNFTYDSEGRLTKMSDSEGNSVNKIFDKDGMLLAHYIDSSQGNVLRATVFLRDVNKRLRGILTPDGIQGMIGYDENGNKQFVTNGGGKGSYFERTESGSLKAIQSASGSEIRKVKFGNERIIVTQDSGRRIDVLIHDDFGNKVLWRNPDSGLTKYQYDKAGNLIEKLDALGNKVRYWYNASNKLVKYENSDGTTRFRYQSGMLAEVSGPSSKQIYSYDDQGRLVRHERLIDGHPFTTEYAYDPNTGKLRSRVIPGGERLSYSYQANQGRLSEVVRKGLLFDRVILKEVAYEPFGRITGFTTTDGNRTEMEYDKSGRIVSKRHSLIGSVKYRYNIASELTRIDYNDQHYRYVYDTDGRLYKTDTVVGKKQYSYDALGNLRRTMISEIENAGARGESGEQVSHKKRDSSGRLVAVGERRWEYNASGRPARFYVGDKLLAEYRYNFKGERISKTVYEGDSKGHAHTTYYLYDLQQRLSAEADADGVITRQYLYLGRLPYAMLENDSVYSIQADHLGAPRRIIDSENRIVWQADYTPFGGAIINTNEIEFNLRRPGQYADVESGLYDNYYRTYDPQRGRYHEPDPIGNLEGMNRYAYVKNRPMEFTDPLGLFGVRMAVDVPVPLVPVPLVPTFMVEFGLGDAVHESILLTAFDAFNRSHPGAFSDHTIDLFIAANIRTDLVFDANHQFNAANHFDNPNDTPWNENSGPSNWINQSINSMKSRRSNYSGNNIHVGCTMDREPIYDISDLVEDFGSLSHTLADFYGHTNWVDPASRGGSYYFERETTEYGIFRENGYVPPGLNMSDIFDFDSMAEDELNSWMTSLYSGNAEGCSTLACGLQAIITGRFNWEGDLYPSADAQYYHNVKGGQDSEGRWDETTHAYWQKDTESSAPSAELFRTAAQLAVRHTVREIERLWAATEGNSALRDIFAASEAQKEDMNVYYAERPRNASPVPDCPLCPNFGSWRDHRVDIPAP